MKTILTIIMLLAFSSTARAIELPWYTGDEKCPPPEKNGEFSPPYNPLDHPNDYPNFPDADKAGWACSYQRNDGVIVQYGDSRTPQEQWLSVWGRNNDGD